ncbi:MAG: hypothetical protein IKN38_04645 [Clostridia bacterium]|nr:hypothetical protein [Clostridia bacterium]
MADNMFGDRSSYGKETVCIDTYRVLDSCRDRDCFRDTKCFLTSFGQEIIERTDSVRTKYAKVVSAFIDIDEVPFNCGFYQLTSKIYVKLICEACLGPGNIQEFEALCVLDKKVCLFGGEGSVSVFKSEGCCSAFCPDPSEESCKASNTMPVAVIETVDPIVLDTKVRATGHPCHCCCSGRDIPSSVQRCMGGDICDADRPKILTVSLGLFSVVRIERPAQLLVSASEYNVPEKQCVEASDDDPCSVFNGIPFPEKEFNQSTSSRNSCGSSRCGCGA